MESTSQPALISVPFADQGSKNVIPVSSQIGITDGAASFTDGFPPLTMTPIAAGGIPPAGGDFNGILNAITQSIRWSCAGGQYSYSSDFATTVGGYPAGAVLLGADLTSLWLSTEDENKNDPSTGNGWVPAFSYGITTLALTASSVTLTAAQASKPTIILTGALTANLTLYFPAWSMSWLVVNNTTGSFTVSAKTSAGTGVNLAASSSNQIYCDGTNIYYGALMVGNNLAEIKAAGTNSQMATRGNIGCGTAATLDATISTLDNTVGRALRVGDFGVGGQTFGVLADNVNVRDRAAYGVNFSRVMNPPDVPSLNSYYNLIMLPETLGGAFSALALPENNSPVYRFFGSGSGGTITQAKIYDELNKPNAVDVGALPISGGELTGPLTVDSTVSVVADQIYVRDAVYQDNGDVCGLEWGNDGGATPGWLSIYLSGQFNRFIELLQLGAAVQVTTWNASGTWPNIPGCVITNVFKDGTDGNLDGIYYAPLQAFKNGSWYTISGGNL